MAVLLPLFRKLIFIICLAACCIAKGQTNLLRNGGFEQIELDTGIYNIVNGDWQTFRLNDTALAWTIAKRQMVLIYSLDWNFRNYDWHSNMTYYTDSGYSHTGKCFALIMPYTIEPGQRLEIHNLCGKLCKPLVAGHKYNVSFFIKAFEGNFFSNQISVAFAESYTNNIFVLEKGEITKTGKEVPLSKAYTVPGILDNKEYKQFSFQYTAKGSEQYIYIGNFHIGYMAKQNSKKTEGFGLYNLPSRQPYIQYAIDDIVVEPLDTSERCNAPLVAEAIVKHAPAPDTILVQSLYFDYNDSVPATTFTKIADTLKMFNNYKQLLIYGYTDNTGTVEYNQRLSAQRAAFVAEKLYGLTNKNIIASGQGLCKQDIEPRLQRRVDVYVIK